MSEERSPPRVFFDSSVVIAGAFSATGAGYILLHLAGLTIHDGRIAPVVRTEALRNVTDLATPLPRPIGSFS